MPEPASEPFSRYRTVVRPEWVDYNGHMHDASYGVVLSDANEELFASLGLSADYRRDSGASLYTVECHIRYLAECATGQSLAALTTLVDADARTVRLYTELVHADGRIAATGEFYYLHVDTSIGRVTAMPDDRLTGVRELLHAHAALPRPAHLGQGVAAARSGGRRTDG